MTILKQKNQVSRSWSILGVKTSGAQLQKGVSLLSKIMGTDFMKLGCFVEQDLREG